VIGVHHNRMGEVPKAFVVKSSSVNPGDNDKAVAGEISKYVEQHKAHYKWLRGGVEFIDAIPRNPSGKILRRLLRDQDKAKQKKQGAKL
jgi:acyl-coenzyme A synthetase/AMP-(fatty) acid ligase